MKVFVSLLVAVSFASALSAWGAQAAGKQVTGTACVRAGVEHGCIVLATTDGKTTYTVTGKNKPKVGTVVKFTGTTQPDVISTCMQGTAVQLTKFTVVRMKCPLPEK